MVDERLLKVWNSLVVPSGTQIFIDVFNVDLPRNTDTSPNIITLQVDMDENYANGVNYRQTVTDSAPSAVPTNEIIIESVFASTNHISKRHILELKVDTLNNIVTAGATLYLMFPGGYSQWITRTQTVDVSLGHCWVETLANAGTNIATQCTFISKRVLKLVVSSAPGSSLTIRIGNLFTPLEVSEGKQNHLRWKLWTTTDGTETTINRYSFIDHSQYFMPALDKSLLGLQWLQHEVIPFVSPTDLQIVSGPLIIYKGYYSRFFELRQDDYPDVFASQI